MNFTCSRGSFLQLSVRQQDFQSTFERSRDLPLTFCATLGPSVIFSQLSVRLRVFPSTFVNFLCVCGTFRQLFVRPQIIHQLSLRPHNLRQLPSTFHASTGPSGNLSDGSGTFRQISVGPWDLPSTSVNFRAPTGSFVSKLRPQNLLSTSVDFPCICRIYHKLASTFHEAGEPPVNFPSYRLTFRQLSLRPRDLSNSFHFPLLFSSSSSSRVSYPELMKYSLMILFISLTQ